MNAHNTYTDVEMALRVDSFFFFFFQFQQKEGNEKKKQNNNNNNNDLRWCNSNIGQHIYKSNMFILLD